MSTDKGFQKFREGDRVRLVTYDKTLSVYNDGLSVGDFGTVQGYVCEYGDHYVGVKFDSRRNTSELHEDYLEAVEDPYEYGIQTILADGTVLKVNEYDWHSQDMAEKVRESRLERWSWMGSKNTAKLVKRRKAGQIEDV